MLKCFRDKISQTYQGRGCSSIYSSQSGHLLSYCSLYCGNLFLGLLFYLLLFQIEKSGNPAEFLRAWKSCACITCSKKKHLGVRDIKTEIDERIKQKGGEKWKVKIQKIGKKARQREAKKKVRVCPGDRMMGGRVWTCVCVTLPSARLSFLTERR